MRGLAATGVVSIGRRRARPAGALQPGQAQPGPRPHHARGPRHPLQARRDGGRLPDQQAAAGAQEAQASSSRTSGRTTRTSSTCAGTGQGERGPDADKGSYDSLAFWCRPACRSGRSRPDYDRLVGPPGAGLRRLHRRHDHRRRHHGRALPPRAHGRGHHGRRLAARHGHVGHGPGLRARRSSATRPGTARRPTRRG